MLTALLIALIIGAIAGWLAGLLVQGTGFGLLGDILVGIVGALMTSVLLPDNAWRRPDRRHPRGDHRRRHPALDRQGDTTTDGVGRSSLLAI